MRHLPEISMRASISFKFGTSQTDLFNHVIRRVDLSASGVVVSTIAGRSGVTGYDNGIGTNTLFSVPSGISLNAAGSIAIVVSMCYLLFIYVYTVYLLSLQSLSVLDRLE